MHMQYDLLNPLCRSFAIFGPTALPIKFYVPLIDRAFFHEAFSADDQKPPYAENL